MQEINLKLIKDRRKENGLTLQKMAENLGFKDASTYYKYEKGIYKFKAEHIPVLSERLNIILDEIFFAA